MIVKVDDKPIVKRYVLKINNMGDIVETVNLSDIMPDEKDDLLSLVFTQGLKRLGYECSP